MGNGLLFLQLRDSSFSPRCVNGLVFMAVFSQCESVRKTGYFTLVIRLLRIPIPSRAKSLFFLAILRAIQVSRLFSG